jgi:RNA polymerase sigma factor (sigma-70 family)
MTSTSDEAVTREARFESLFLSNRAGIFGYFLRRAHSNPDAADLLAETFLIAWRKLDEVPAQDAGRLWLFGVARRLLANYHRHERVENSMAAKLRVQMAGQAEQHFGREVALFDEVIASSVDSLRTEDREIIELSAWENLTPTEIANVMGMKPGTVRVRLHRIRRIIASHLISAGYPAATDADCTG